MFYVENVSPVLNGQIVVLAIRKNQLLNILMLILMEL